jgi:histidine decarboxylase
LYGLYLAREAFPDGIVYYSEHTHYSVAKLVRVLGVRNIMIRGLPNGEIDYEDLKATLQIHRDVPPIILANDGAIDDLLRIKKLLQELAVTRSYIHCDAALSGMLLPWVDDPQPFGFSHGIDSISVSGHKFIGSPMPCGIVIARQANVDRVARLIEYVGASDTTIAGSRNALTPIVIWLAIQRWGEQGLRDRMRYSEQLADYAIAEFAKIGVEAWRHRNSVTVVFPRPSSELIARWQIAPSQDIAHIITLPHVTPDMIDQLIADIAKGAPTDE